MNLINNYNIFLILYTVYVKSIKLLSILKPNIFGFKIDNNLIDFYFKISAFFNKKVTVSVGFTPSFKRFFIFSTSKLYCLLIGL